jgi:uncharacterized protein
MDDNEAEVRRLLDEGLDPDSADHGGLTPLHFAALRKAAAAAAVLLGAGASVDPVNSHGNTPLWDAVFSSKGDGQMIELLRTHGADPWHENNYGKSPVEIARTIGNFDVARFFADLPES